MKSNKLSNNVGIITMFGHNYEAQLLDHTHIKFRMLGSNKWGWGQHYGQLRPEVIKQIKELGYHHSNGNWFLYNDEAV